MTRAFRATPTPAGPDAGAAGGGEQGDAELDAALAAAGARMNQSALDAGDVLGALPIKELMFATRAKAPDAGVLAAMYASAKARGVAWNEKALKHVDHSKCKH